METKKMVPTPVQVTTGLQHHLHHPNLQQQQQQQQLLMQQQLQQQQQQQQLLVQQSSKQPSQQQQPRGKGGGDGGGEGGGLSLSGVRRRSGHQQGLRSPAAKRPISAPVALQGWLYKQGSEGLMLWKKRWFVLSEYCLFYYKGPEEEKLLGSILLPSYQVTVCHAEDKVTKKFAFKAEHANMRTYHFAAESRESMSQWVNALTLASLVQDPNPAGVNAANNAGPTATGDDRSARPSLSSVSSTVNQSADDSDSGFHGFQSRDDPSHTSNNNSSPNSVNTGFPANSNDNYNKLHNNNFKNDPQQPLMNGMMHPQQSDYRSQQMMDSQSPYGHLLMRPGVISPTGEHQHQTLIYQQHPQLAQQMQMIQQLKHEGQMSQQQQQQKTSPSGNNVNTVQPTPRNYGQPVYANAPPKPRRLNENPNDFSTPSPESDYHKSPMSPEARLGNKGPMTVTEFLDARNSNSIYGQRMTTQPSLRTDKSGLTYGFTQPLNGQPAERRTPDTYGRSNAKPISRQQMRNGLDYEDVYSNPPPQLYQKPAGPVGYVKDTTPTSNPMALYTQHQPQQKPQQLMNPQYYVVSGLISNGEFSAPVMRQQQPPRSEQPPRPHSADFLEYEASRRPNLQTNTESGESVDQQRCPQRPKSSLDVVNPSDLAAINDKYFYSEERYAAQMRQSAVYLHQTPPQQQQQQAQTAQSRNQSLPRATTPSKSTASRDNESGIGTLSEMSNSSVRRSRKKHYSEQPAAYSLQRHTELTTSEQAHLRRSLRETRGPVQHGQYSPGRSLPRDYSHAMPVVGPGFEDRRLDQQQFARSASARLPRSRHPSAIIDYDDDDDDDESYGDRNMSQNIKDGDRKIQQREESMKRLLEWKQRMLQSPLTRKPTVSSNGSNQRNQHNSDLANCYKQQALLELAAHEASLTAQTSSHRHRRRDNTHHMRSHYPRSKSTDAHRSESAAMNDAVGNHNAFPRYSSYSSDDEELSDVRRKRTRRIPHSGRSPRGFEKEQIQLQSPASTISARSVNSAKHQEQLPASIRSSSVCSGTSITDFGSSTPREVVFDDRPVSRPQSKLDCPVKEIQPMRQSYKKPSGILKTSGTYSSNSGQKNDSGRLSSLAGHLPGDSWPTQKNVQWVSQKDDDKEEWDSKIDESKVNKEYYHHYAPDVKGNSMDSSKKKEAKNLVQSRIRSFEGNTGLNEDSIEDSSQKEAAYSSRIMESPKKIREFVLGDEKEEISEDEEEVDQNKSVKDLLADFEKKSQQLKQQEHENRQLKEMKHRGVFSDTETLLYETGSDLDQPDKSFDEDEETERIIAKYKKQAKEKSLETQQNKSSDYEKSRDNYNEENLDENINHAFTNLSVSEPSLNHNERHLQHGIDDQTHLSKQTVDPNLEEHYLPMTPRKAILDPNSDNCPTPKMMTSLFAGLNEESSYVEMLSNAGSRSLLSKNSKMQDFGDYSTLENQHYEFVCVSDNKMEPVYMEVSQLAEKKEKNAALNASLKNKDIGGTEVPNSRGDLPDILTALKSDSSDADDESSKELDSIDAPRHPRFSLSDTFRPASYYLGASQTLIAELHDSSDSEIVSPPPIPTSPPPMDDLDSLEMHDSLEMKKMDPQVSNARDYNSHRDSPKSWNKPAAQVEVRRSSPSRFQESNFHDSRMSLESASGSDSVELMNGKSLDEQARYRQMKRRPVSDDMGEVLDSLDELESLENRFAGASIDLDQYLEELQSRDAFNVDLYAKDLSYNSIYGLNENMLVADKLKKLAYAKALGNQTGTSESNASLDQPFPTNAKNKTSSVSSLPSMSVSETPPKMSHQHSQSLTGDAHYENILKFSPLQGSPATVIARSDGEISQNHDQRGHKSHPKTVSSPLANIVATHSRDSSYSFVSGTASVANYSAQRPASAQSSAHHQSPVNIQSTNAYITSQQQQPMYHSRSASQDSAHYSLSPNHRSSSSQDSSQYPTSSSIVTSSNTETRTSSDQTGAPYYYSDLQSANMISEPPENNHQPRPCTIAHTTRLSQLNNQRGDSAGLNKRNDIGRMVNPIQRQMPRMKQADDADEARRIAAELRKTTCQLLAEDKAALVDQRNFYEADTLRRVKSSEPIADAPVTVLEARNLYPHGLKDKSGSQTQLNADSGNEFPAPTQSSHRRSRSLEGLLDEAGLQSLVENSRLSPSNQILETVLAAQQAQSEQVRRRQGQEQRQTESREVTSNARTGNNTFEGEDPWEQDSLWRESLRRVSIRHARSLDNLDMPSPSTAARNQNETPKSRTKITRGVTYVNDSVSNTVERRRLKRRSDETDTNSNRSDTSLDSARRSKNVTDDDSSKNVWNTEDDGYPRPEVSLNHKNQSNRHFLEEGNPVPVQQTAVVTAEAPTANSNTSSNFELDREKLRQWDLLSSACLLQEQQALQAVDGCRHPGRGLPPVIAQSVAATGCASVGDASPRKSPTKIPTTKSTSDKTKLADKSSPPQKLQREKDEVKQLVQAHSNGTTGEWLYRTGATISYRK